MIKSSNFTVLFQALSLWEWSKLKEKEILTLSVSVVGGRLHLIINHFTTFTLGICIIANLP